MSEITIQEIDNEFDNFCRENMCETCSYTNCYNCKMSFINDRYDVEIKKKDPFEKVKEDAEMYHKAHIEFCNTQTCATCVLQNRNVSTSCLNRFIIAKERGIL